MVFGEILGVPWWENLVCPSFACETMHGGALFTAYLKSRNTAVYFLLAYESDGQLICHCSFDVIHKRLDETLKISPLFVSFSAQTRTVQAPPASLESSCWDSCTAGNWWWACRVVLSSRVTTLKGLLIVLKIATNREKTCGMSMELKAFLQKWRNVNIYVES